MLKSNQKKSRKYTFNEDFFKVWSSQMAYVLGFACADGNVYFSTLAWDLSDKFESNKILLEKINYAFSSTYPIRKRKASHRLRLNSSILTGDLREMGIMPNKKKILKFPNVPDEFLRDFIRGFLDGDGWVSIRSRENCLKEFSIGFSNGSLDFMNVLIKKLGDNVSLSGHNLRTRKKITPNDVKTITYQLEYYSHNAFKLIKYLYDDLDQDDLYLGRKFNKQIEAREVYLEYSLKSKKLRNKESEFKDKMKNILHKLMIDENLNGAQIAKVLGVHSSSVYRWLKKFNIKRHE